MVDRPRIRVLGSIEVDGGASGTAFGPRLRTTLARLVVDRGRPVSEGALLEAVWAGDEVLPTNPGATLATYASRLRSLLGAGAIERYPSGFALAVEAVDLDAA